MSEVSKVKMLCTWGEKCRDRATCSEKMEHIDNICLHFLSNTCSFKPCKKIHAEHVADKLYWKVNEVTFKVNPAKLPKPKVAACPQEEKVPANSCDSLAQGAIGNVNEEILVSLTLNPTHMKNAFLAFGMDDMKPMHDLQVTITLAIEALAVQLKKVKDQLRK
jgi:hypothetical protein